jgi:hypothetical protein
VTDRCEFTDLPVDQCAHCLGLAAEPERLAEDRAAYLASDRWTPARFPGRCAACGEWTIEEGDPIRLEEGLGWYGALCCDDPDETG